MFKFKLLKVGIVIVSLISFLISPFADYIKSKTLRRYDLRWHQEADHANQVHTILVRNAGTELKDNLVLELNFGAGVSRVLRDFEVSPGDGGPAEKFLDAVARTSSTEPVGLFTAAETTRLTQLLDRHFANRSLNSLDNVFDDILRTRLEAANGSQALTLLRNKNQTTETWHDDWSKQCGGDTNADCTSVDAVLGTWEKARSGFRNAVLQNWKDRTGISLASDSDHLSLDKRLLMTLSLGPNEHRLFKFYYSHNPGNVGATFRSMKGEQAHQLTNRNEVFSSFVRLLFDLHPIFLALVFVLLPLLFVFGPLLLPLQIVPIHQIFNFALESRDEDYWKHAFERHRYFILRQFRVLWKREESQAVMSEQEVLDLIRDWLIARDDNGSPRFKSTRSLNRSIHNELWRLALQT